MSIRKVPFGTLESGEAADLYILTNASGASVEITNFGGIIRAINVPDRDGKIGNVVLGYKDVSGYQPLCGYLGALIGRVGNRIADGKCVLDGKELTLAKNEGGVTHLHGGNVGAADVQPHGGHQDLHAPSPLTARLPPRGSGCS